MAISPSPSAGYPGRAAIQTYLVVQTFAERLLIFVIPVAVYARTGKVQYGGVAFLVEWLPMVLVLPLAGMVADRWGTANTLRWSNITRAVLCLALALLVWREPSVWVLITAGGILSLTNIFAYIGFEKFTSGLEAGQVAQAYSFFQLNQYGMQVLSPIFGSWALTRFAPPAILIGTGVVYALLAAGGWRLPVGERPAPGPERPDRTTLPGVVTAVLRDRRLTALCLLMFAVNFVFGVMTSALPALVIGGGRQDLTLGIVYAVAALLSLGYFLGAGAIDRRGLVAPAGRLAAVVTALAPVLLLVSASDLMIAVAFVLASAPIIAFSVWARVLRNSALPPEGYALGVSIMMIASTSAMPVAGGYIAVAPTYLRITTAVALAGVFAAALCVVGLVRLARHDRARVDATVPVPAGPDAG